MTADPMPQAPVTNEQLNEVIGLLGELVTETKAGREATDRATSAVDDEADVRRRQVRWTRWLVGMVAVVTAVVLIGGGVYIVDRIAENEVTCSERRARARIADERTVVAVDIVGRFAELDVSERAQLRSEVTRGLNEFPPPC